MLVGSLTMQVIALVVNNIDPRRRYPRCGRALLVPPWGGPRTLHRPAPPTPPSTPPPAHPLRRCCQEPRWAFALLSAAGTSCACRENHSASRFPPAPPQTQLLVLKPWRCHSRAAYQPPWNPFGTRNLACAALLHVARAAAVIERAPSCCDACRPAATLPSPERQRPKPEC